MMNQSELIPPTKSASSFFYGYSAPVHGPSLADDPNLKHLVRNNKGCLTTMIADNGHQYYDSLAKPLFRKVSRLGRG
jgi:hypothetical protein